MFTVILHKRAEKDIDSMDRRIWRDSLREEVFALSVDFMKGKRLDGVFEGCRSKRVGDYRILYRVFFEESIVEVISIKHRKDVYKPG
jgi:mRNA-degrading endonuclease RelE of RelBE toxin-antitoxin system